MWLILHNKALGIHRIAFTSRFYAPPGGRAGGVGPSVFRESCPINHFFSPGIRRSTGRAGGVGPSVCCESFPRKRLFLLGVK